MRTKESKGDVLDTARRKNLTISSVLFPDVYCLFERPFLDKARANYPRTVSNISSFHRKNCCRSVSTFSLLCQLKQKATNIQD